MSVLKRFKLSEVMDYIGKQQKLEVSVQSKVYNVNIHSLRLKCFKNNHICVCCGVEGEIWKLEQTLHENPHFNLYTKNHILMTRDHIIPLSSNGKDNLSNLQTMCQKCNSIKRHYICTIEQLKEYVVFFNQNINACNNESLLKEKRDELGIIDLNDTKDRFVHYVLIPKLQNTDYIRLCGMNINLSLLNLTTRQNCADCNKNIDYLRISIDTTKKEYSITYSNTSKYNDKLLCNKCNRKNYLNENN